MSAPILPVHEYMYRDPVNTRMEDPATFWTSNWTINVSDVKTVQINNLSHYITERSIRDFFAYTGEIIIHVELRRESGTTQLAYVTFKESQGADTALLLSGSIIGQTHVTISPVEDYILPPEASPASSARRSNNNNFALTVAEEVVSTMIAKGYVMGKNALHKAKEFDDEILHLTSNATAIDERVGLIEKLNQGMAAVRKMERQFQVKETTRSAIHLARTAGSALLDSDNEYVATGASWVSGAFAAMAKAAANVKVMTREKLERAAEEKRAVLLQERTGSIFVNKLAHMHFDHQRRRHHHHNYISQSDPRKLTFY
ncbi:Binding partner of ACD11 1 [Linum perenne]